jgi:hypothetical protein
VLATGARPAENGGQRELFTEETTTVLVFENGGVLRLSAAVVPGQLLFLTHLGTKREVVAQVTCKRDFRPTICYVEVEFTEAAPGFWGVDFPATPQLAPATTQQKEAAELVLSAKVIPGKPSAPAPSAHEVTALKQEVEALREQLKLLQTQTVPAIVPAPANVSAPASVSAPAHVAPPAAVPDPPAAPAITEAPSKTAPIQTPAIAQASNELPPNPTKTASEIPPREPASEPSASASLPTQRGGPSFSEEVYLPKPVIRVHHTDPGNASAKSKRTSHANPRSKTSRIALLFAALLLAATSAAWFQNWIPWLPQPKMFSASATPSAAPPKLTDARANSSNAKQPNTVPAPQPGAVSPAATQSASQIASHSVTAPLTPAGDAKPSTLGAPETPAPAKSSPEEVVDRAEPSESEVAASAAKRSEQHASLKTMAVSSAPLSPGPDIVPPKLIKSVRPIASPDALEYFSRDRTAAVTLDAVVDATGRVKSMKVLSGPAALRDSAINALKQYRYEPATLHGKPVAVHVTVAIKFLFEP